MRFFFKFGRLHFCGIFFGRKVAILGGTAKNCFVLIQKVKGKIRAKLIVLYFVLKSTNPRSALQVVQISRSLFLEIR